MRPLSRSDSGSTPVSAVDSTTRPGPRGQRPSEVGTHGPGARPREAPLQGPRLWPSTRTATRLLPPSPSPPHTSLPQVLSPGIHGPPPTPRPKLRLGADLPRSPTGQRLRDPGRAPGPAPRAGRAQPRSPTGSRRHRQGAGGGPPVSRARSRARLSRRTFPPRGSLRRGASTPGPPRPAFCSFLKRLGPLPSPRLGILN